jgi:hypothetical protein
MNYMKIMNCEIMTNDLGQKIGDTIVRYDGIPYYVRVAAGDLINLFDVASPSGKTVQQVDARDPLFDISSLPLGYVNYQLWKQTFYVTRFPKRQVKQGVIPQNTKINYFPNLHWTGGFPRSQDVLFNKAFKDSVMGVFPPLENAIKGLRGIHTSNPSTHYSVAISRDIALVIDEQAIVKVYYKNRYVGWIAPNDNIVNVNETDGMGWVVSKYLSDVLGWVIV